MLESSSFSISLVSEIALRAFKNLRVLDFSSTLGFFVGGFLRMPIFCPLCQIQLSFSCRIKIFHHNRKGHVCDIFAFSTSFLAVPMPHFIIPFMRFVEIVLVRFLEHPLQFLFFWSFLLELPFWFPLPF